MEFEKRHQSLQGIFDADGAETAVEAAEALMEMGLDDEQSQHVRLMKAQFVIAIPERIEEGAEELHCCIEFFRRKHMPGHPDRDQIENIDRQAFGPKSLANPSGLKLAWETYQKSARLSNDGEVESAKQLLESLSGLEDRVLRAHVLMGHSSIAWNCGNPEKSIEFAQESADAVAELEPGHWARRTVEKTIIPKVAVVRKSVFPEPARGQLSKAIRSINAQDPDSLRLWREALAALNGAYDENAKAEAQRIDRLLTGFEGPLALLVAMERMQKAKSREQLDEIIATTESAYYIAYEHGADSTARELERFLESVGRF